MFEISNLLNIITLKIQMIVSYVDTLVGGNEFASALILTSIISVVTYSSRNIPNQLYQFCKHQLTTTLQLNNTNDSFDDLMTFFHNKNFTKSIRSIKITDGGYSQQKAKKEIGYGTHYFVYKHTPLRIIVRQESGSVSHNIKEFLTITKFGRSHKIFDTLITTLKKKNQNVNVTILYGVDGNYLKKINQTQSRNLDSMFNTEENNKKLRDKLIQFQNNKSWCKKHNIPHQLGLLFHGPSGSGKTTLIKCVAGELNYDICIVSTLTELINSLKSSKKVIIVLEEIDTFGLNERKHKEENSEKKKEISSQINDYGLGLVLNSLDGLISNPGRIIIATTNHKYKLDKALLRPGRIDLQLEIGYVDEYMFRNVLEEFYPEEYNSFKNLNFKMRRDITMCYIQNDIIDGLTCSQLFQKYAQIMVE